MSKILLIGDPHVRHTHLTEGEVLLKWIEEVVEDTKPDLVVNLGDTFDDHAVIRAECLSLVNSHVRRLTEKTQLIMVLGNHDMWRPNSSSYHALEVFKDRKNVVVADSHTVVDGITYIPYLPTGSAWPTIKTKVAITHNTFVGADFGFKLAEDGFDLGESACDVVISGHIHKKQNLRNVFYPGTPMAMSASDVDQVKGIHLFDTVTNDVTFIESPFPMWKSFSFKVGVDKSLNLDDKHRWILKLVGPRPEVKAFLESKELQQLKSNVHLSIKVEFTDSIKQTNKSISYSTVPNMVDRYIDTVYNGQIDRQVIKNTIKNYMGNV